MEGRPQEIAAGVAGEDASGPVSTVGRRCEPEDQDPRLRVAEAGDRPAPILVVAEPGDLLARDPLPPLDEARAAPALDDLGLERGEATGSVAGAAW